MANESNQPQSERIVVEIYGVSYPLRTDNPDEIKKMAELLDKKMKAMSRTAKTFDDRKVAVLTALQLIEDYEHLKKDYDELAELLDEK